MPTQRAFELLAHLQGLPIEPLVDALRELHRRGQHDRRPVALHPWLEMASATVSQPMAAPAAPPADGANYEEARRHFVEHAVRLRQQAVLASRLLDGLMTRSGALPPLQRELRIRCARGGQSAARFTVTNCLQVPVLVSFRAGHVHAPGVPMPLITFDPETVQLSPLAETSIRISVALSTEVSPAAVVDVGVDVLGDERLLLKLWLRIEVEREEQTDGR